MCVIFSLIFSIVCVLADPASPQTVSAIPERKTYFDERVSVISG